MNEHEKENHDWTREMIIHPVGFVQSELKDPSLAAGREGLQSSGEAGDVLQEAHHIRELVSHILVNPALDGILDGLTAFSHALILYWPHLAKPESRTLTHVHPMGRRDLPEVGVFATCSPARPNPILVTAVQVLGVHANVLTVQGLEAVDRSPVLDIKPYNRNYLQVEGLKVADWMERIEQERGE